MIWGWVDDEGVSRVGGRGAVDGKGEVRISLKRTSIAVSETPSVSWWESVGISNEKCWFVACLPAAGAPRGELTRWSPTVLVGE